MREELSDERWQQFAGLQEGLEESDAVLPIRISSIDGSQVQASPRAVMLAEALAFNDGWSGISDARRRHPYDLAA
ncbi:MAG: hypothetical protein KDB58_00640 [Solirubrobacterales bacterium]|nr:hypothetical protein [Solirubrobacterales bacterium]MCB8971286.1 hypothetical protein [Thermoleophilales bacterium]MCO5325857.1 hypothetical protein [Solirubrobacterales bacterium]